MLTYAYLPIFNLFLIIYPMTLSYDWQMGSIPLVETIRDSRNFATFFFYITLFALVRKDFNSRKVTNYQFKNAYQVLKLFCCYLALIFKF